MVPLSPDDLYYVGHETDNQWSLEGVFTELNLAVSNMIDGQFVARIPVNVMLPLEHIQPSQAWWMLDGTLLKSEYFIEEES